MGAKGEMLKKVLAQLGEKAGDAGKIGLGAASLGTKKAAKIAKDNPKAAAALGGVAAGVAGTKAIDDEDDEPKKKSSGRGGALEKFLRKKKMTDEE